MTEPTTRQPMKVASPKDVKKVVGNMEEAFLRCRDMGHNWRQSRVTRVPGGFERTLYCSSCKTNRNQLLSRRGVVTHSSYDYADGYQIKGLGRVQADAKSVLRLESLNRAIDHSDKDFDMADA